MKTNAKPRRTKRACAQRARKLKRSGDPKAASRLARYCPPPGRRKPNGRVRTSPMGHHDAASHVPDWRDDIPRGTVLYAVARRESRSTYRTVAEFVYIHPSGEIRYVPPNLSILAGFGYDYPSIGRGGVVLPNGAGSVQDYVEAVGRALYGDSRALKQAPGYYL